MISAFAIFQRRRHDGRDSDKVSLAPARRKARRRQPVAAERRGVPAAGAVICVIRRPFAHLLLARAERRQPARISRPHRDDGDQHVGLAAAFVALAAIFCAGRPARRTADTRAAADCRGRRPLCLVDRADRARLSFRALSDRAAGQRPVRRRRAFRSLCARLGPVRHRLHDGQRRHRQRLGARPGCCGMRKQQ